MNVPGAGSQFPDDLYLGIDPSLLGSYSYQPGFRHPQASTLQFAYDVDTATDASISLSRDDFASWSGTSSTLTHAQQTALNPHAQHFTPEQRVQVASHLANRPASHHGERSHRRPHSGRRQCSAGSHRAIWHHWRASNGLVHGAADPLTPQSERSQHDRSYNTPTMSYSTLPYWTPPSSKPRGTFAPSSTSSGQAHHFTLAPPQMQPFPSVERGRTEATLPGNVPMMNFSRLPANLPPSENIMPWNQGTYNPGDRTHSEMLVPPTPTPVRRSQRDDSAVPSQSSHTLSCGTCGKDGFERQCDLDHHQRWHGERFHICDVCGTGFVAEKDLRRHVLTHDKSERPFHCDHVSCKYHQHGFARMDHLKRHKQKRHPTD